MFKIYMVNRNRQMRGVFKIYDEPESPNEGACLRYMMKRNRQITGQFTIYDEPKSPNEGARLRCLMKRNRQVREHVSDIC